MHILNLIYKPVDSSSACPGPQATQHWALCCNLVVGPEGASGFKCAALDEAKWAAELRSGTGWPS